MKPSKDPTCCFYVFILHVAFLFVYRLTTGDMQWPVLPQCTSPRVARVHKSLLNLNSTSTSTSTSTSHSHILHIQWFPDWHSVSRTDSHRYGFQPSAILRAWHLRTGCRKPARGWIKPENKTTDITDRHSYDMIFVQSWWLQSPFVIHEWTSSTYMV